MDGPLLRAMREGGFLYIEEFNRAPEDTINTLLTAMAERQVTVPTAGTVAAAPTFRVIASMNPYDNVGTTRLSTSVHDRICRLAVSYQDAAAETGIVALRAPLPGAAPRPVRPPGRRRRGGHPGHPRAPGHPAGQQRARCHRPHPGGRPAARPAGDRRAGELAEGYPELVYDAMVVALSGRIFLDETVDADAGGGAAADLGGPVHPDPGRGGPWLKDSASRLAAAAARLTRRQPRATRCERRPKQLDAEPRAARGRSRRRGAGGLVAAGGRGPARRREPRLAGQRRARP